jgi:hypothetical protein
MVFRGHDRISAVVLPQGYDCDRGFGLQSVIGDGDAADAMRSLRDLLLLPRRGARGHIGTRCILIAVDCNRE